MTWLRENPVLLALIVVAVVAGMFVLMAAVEWFGTWLIARSERRQWRWRLTSSRLSIRLLDPYRIFRCALHGHRWDWNPANTQRVCYRCWTVDDWPPERRRASHGEAR